VEAYFPPYGWIEFDPTPTDPGQPNTGFVRLISNLTDAIDLWWWEAVLNYDDSRQYRVLSTLQAALEKCQQSIGSFFARVYEKGRLHVSIVQTRNLAASLGEGSIIWAAFLPLVVLLLVRRWRRRVFSRIQRMWHYGNARTVAASFFAEALELLGDRGLKLERGQTALEFARSLRGKPPGDPFLALTQMYYSTRFGPSDRPFNRADAQIQLRLLRDSLRKA
jgi:hypothetical protein